MDNDKITQMIQRENVTLSSFRSRSLAFVIDELLISVLFMFIVWDTITNLASSEQLIVFINSNAWQIIFLKIIYHTFFIWMYGATLGKMALKIKVVSIDLLDNPTLAFALLRSIARIFSETIFYMGFIWAYFDKHRQTWQDKISHTLVIDA